MLPAYAGTFAGHPALRKTAFIVEALVGVSALAGGYGLVSDAEALGMKREWLDGTPFDSYTIPGLFLLIVIGGGMLGAAVLSMARPAAAPIAALAMGAVLLAWLLIETALIGYVGYEQVLMVVLYGVAGFVLVSIGLRALRRE